MKNLFLIFFYLFISISYGQDNADSAKVYSIGEVEVKSEFPGGDGALIDYLLKINFNDIFEECMIFTFYYSFEIDTNGKAQNITMLRKREDCMELFNNLEKQLITIFSEMPNWTPGMILGKKVRVKYTVPLRIHPG